MRHIGLIAMLVAVLALPSAAFAQLPSDGYGGVEGVTPPAAEEEAAPEGAAPNGGAPAPRAAVAAGGEARPAAGELPFTGAEVGLAAAIGILLVGAGFALRRLRTE